MKVLVCGGRDYDNYKEVLEILRYLEERGRLTEVIHGGASGADAAAELAAGVLDVPQTCYRAEWEKHGRKAGPLRNQRMLDEGKPDLVIAFPGGRGTLDMKQRAWDAGVPVWEIPW